MLGTESTRHSTPAASPGLACVLRTGWIRLVVAAGAPLLVPLCLGVAAAAQQPDSPPSKDDVAKQQAAWRELLDRQPAEYRIYLDTKERTALTLRKAPVLRWANYTRFDTLKVRDAATYVWTARGRPEVVACAFPVTATGTTIRLDVGSLSRGSLFAERQGQRVWYPKKPGVTFQPVPDGPAPAKSAVARLRQMKTLARRFSSTLLRWREDGSDREELRMLPQPVYRYESKDPDVLDGTMFFFVQGTDPESLLLLEAVREGSGYQWQFALARRSSGALTAQYRDKTVWKVPLEHTPRNPERTRIEIDHRVRLPW